MPWVDRPSSDLAGSDVECKMENTSSNTCQAPSSGTSSGSPSGTSGATSNGSAGCGGGSSDPSATTGTCNTSGNTPTGGTRTRPSQTWADVFFGSNGGYCTTATDPSENSGDLVEECVPVTPDENWLGCVGSRVSPYNQQAAYGGRKIPLIYDRTCGQALTSLTKDYPRVRQNITDLTASGSTYIPSGLQWGWRTLTPEAPFESNDEGDRQKLLILMTDGDNTRSQSSTTHDGSDVAAANTLTLDLCNEIKASGIQLATVSYSQGGSGGSDDVLKQCASSPDLYFKAQDATKLRKAFEAAFESIRDVRLVY